jgi:hypothetical protein
MEEKLVTAMTFSTLWEAEMALSRLVSEEIPAYLKDGETVNMNWLLSNAIGGVKVQVAEADLTRAREVLSTPCTSEEWEDYGSVDTVTCPRCKNQDIRYVVRGRRWTFLTWVLFGIPLLWPGKRLYCGKCGFKWKQTGQK